jgi:hypothetical protein
MQLAGSSVSTDMDIRINHDEGVDIEAKINGKTGAFEYKDRQVQLNRPFSQRRKLLLENMI